MAKKRKFSGLRCSFCGKADSEVAKLIAGPGVYICDECVGLCNDILNEVAGKPVVGRTFGDWNDDELLLQLKPRANVVKQAEASMTDIVRILRDRTVTWARIGEALGVSRQAAWERFSGEE